MNEKEETVIGKIIDNFRLLTPYGKKNLLTRLLDEVDSTQQLELDLFERGYLKILSKNEPTVVTSSTSSSSTLNSSSSSKLRSSSFVEKPESSIHGTVRSRSRTLANLKTLVKIDGGSKGGEKFQSLSQGSINNVKPHLEVMDHIYVKFQEIHYEIAELEEKYQKAKINNQTVHKTPWIYHLKNFEETCLKMISMFQTMQDIEGLLEDSKYHLEEVEKLVLTVAAPKNEEEEDQAPGWKSLSSPKLRSIEKCENDLQAKHTVFVNYCKEFREKLPYERKEYFEQNLLNTLNVMTSLQTYLHKIQSCFDNSFLKNKLESKFGNTLSSKIFLKFPWTKNEDAEHAKKRSMSVHGRLQSNPEQPRQNQRRLYGTVGMEIHYIPIAHLIPIGHMEGTQEFQVTSGKKVSIGRTAEEEIVFHEGFIGFPSRVVSRAHAELWFVSGSLYLRDTKSRSGTFINAMRLSESEKESKPFKISNGDLIQFGVDLKGSTKPEEKSVVLRAEIKKVPQTLKRLTIMTIRQNFSKYKNEDLQKLPASLRNEVLNEK